VSARRIVLLYGSRSWRHPDPIAAVVAELEQTAIVLNGGAPGADRMGALAAKRRGLHVATMPALWDYYRRPGGKNPAGPIRNRAMAAFPLAHAWGFRASGLSDGTDDMTGVLHALGVPVELVHEEEL
jgi:hypothetical protein